LNLAGRNVHNTDDVNSFDRKEQSIDEPQSSRMAVDRCRRCRPSFAFGGGQ
jgi:hypothetical protein